MHKLLMVLGLAVAVGGCATDFTADFAADSRYRNEGPGNELYSAETHGATENLRKYFQELASQADLPKPDNPDAGNGFIVQSPDDWNILVRTGMNDIDLRCDNYLTWIDQKRAERIVVNESITAISALTAGILGLAAPETSAISYIALGLGFAGTVYNSYQNSILMGLESSTIKTIVHESRQRLRAEWRKVDFTNKPDVVYALRSYLRICTPQAITLDVNTYSRDGITGKSNRLTDEMKRHAAAVGVIAPKQSAGKSQKRGKVVSPPSYDKVFVLEPGWPPQKVELDELLKYMCFRKTSSRPVFSSDGLPKPELMSSIAIAEDEIYRNAPNDSKRNRKINRNEFDQIVAARTECASKNVQNYHEANQYTRDGTVVGLIEKINRISPDCILKMDETLAVGGRLRARIRQLRAALANNLTDDKNLIGVEEQLTVALSTEIHRLATKTNTTISCNNP